MSYVLNKSLEEWIKECPIIYDLVNLRETFWINSNLENSNDAFSKLDIGEKHIRDAEERLKRFAPFIKRHFKETEVLNGMIESPIEEIKNMKKQLEEMHNVHIDGKLLIKKDSHLAIAGSIKARGGIYEVLKHTEDLAIENGLIKFDDDYSKLADEKNKKIFSNYTIQVGSTGNLGLSIGIMSAKIGYKVIVHMSADAKEWKKQLLRSKGVNVVEYKADFSKAVEEGRKLSDKDPNSYFVDDENSPNLFLGYSVAASRLKKQLDELKIKVDEDHPLFVYLPCGVGGGPGGVTFGLKSLFKDNVHCFFVEPVHSPCMLLGMASGYDNKVCVQDFGIDNITEADGLAVGRASAFVGKVLKNILSGIYTINDEILYAYLNKLSESEEIYLEPSACAGFYGPVHLMKNEKAIEYLKENNLEHKMKNSCHIVWATGGSLVPREVMRKYVEKGKNIFL